MPFLSGELLEWCDEYLKTGNSSAIRMHLDMFLASDKYLEWQFFWENMVLSNWRWHLPDCSLKMVHGTLIRSCHACSCMHTHWVAAAHNVWTCAVLCNRIIKSYAISSFFPLPSPLIFSPPSFYLLCSCSANVPSYLLARSVQEKEKQKSSLCCVRDTWLHAHWLHTHWLLRYELCCVTHVRTYGRSHGDSNAGRLEETCIYSICSVTLRFTRLLWPGVYTQVQLIVHSCWVCDMTLSNEWHVAVVCDVMLVCDVTLLRVWHDSVSCESAHGLVVAMGLWLPWAGTWTPHTYNDHARMYIDLNSV